MKRYLVLTLRTPRFDPAVIEAHYSHLEALQEQGALEAFGPFTDKSGGAYLVRAESLDEARAMAFADPVHATGSSIVTVREWDLKFAIQAQEARTRSTTRTPRNSPVSANSRRRGGIRMANRVRCTF